MEKFIPITNITSNTLCGVNHYYFFHNDLRWKIDRQVISFNKDIKRYSVLTLLRDENLINARERIGASRQAWKAAGNKYAEGKQWLVASEEPIALMPIEVFDLLMEKFNTLPMKSREPMWKFYCHLYYNDAKYGGEYQQSQEQMTKELGMGRNLISRALNTFIGWGVLRREGRYCFSGEKSFAYKHTIPEPLRCGKVFHETCEY